MTTARREIIVSGEEAVYHCISRCVRRAYLCGFDRILGRSFEHRRRWVRNRLKFLASVFGIEVLSYAVMENHTHTMLRTRPDLVLSWTDEEVATRWLRLYPRRKGNRGAGYVPSSDEIYALTLNESYLKEIRNRLGSISWFMKSLNEYIARRANLEDGCKGRFWEGRFRCQKLSGEPAILSCSMYIDLNPVRAGMARGLDDSRFTSAIDRIRSFTARQELRRRESDGDAGLSSMGHLHSRLIQDSWLTPICDEGGRRGFLSMDVAQYLELLDATGCELRDGKRGRITKKIELVLEEARIKSEKWIDIATNFGKSFYLLVGDEQDMRRSAQLSGRNWFKGVRAAAQFFH